jgi:hypothetical protein
VEAGSGDPVLRDWKEALTNRAFVVFALGMTGYFVLFNQLYLGLPFEVRRLTGGDLGVGVMFALSSLVWISAQMRVTAYCKACWSPARSIVTGLGLMGLAFVPPLAALPLLPLRDAALHPALLWTVNLSPVLLSTVLLTLGMLVAKPFAMDAIPFLSGGRRLGTYYGLYYVVGGMSAAAGNAAAGAAFDLARALGVGGLPWLVMLAVGFASAATILALGRAGRLPG